MKTFIINLPHRSDRRERSLKELALFEPEVWEAEQMDNGAEGLFISMKNLMAQCLLFHWHPVLICEDDVRLLYDKQVVKFIVDYAMVHMPTDWHQLYLGANIERPGSLRAVNGWLYQVSYAKAMHACIYSREGLQACLEVDTVPFDEGVAALHKNGHAYITNPMLADQYPGYSDIRQKRVSYNFMQQRYNDGVIKS